MTLSIRAAVLAIGLLCICTAANASQILFSGAVTGFQDLDGNDSTTPVSGFSIGEMLTGRIDIRDSALAPGAVFGNDDILGYSFLLGDTELTDDQTSIGGTVNADGSGLADFLAYTGFTYLSDDCSFCTSEIRQDGFRIDSFSDSGGTVLGSLSTRIESDSVSDVPAPGGIGLGLAGFALIGALALHRKRFAQTAVAGNAWTI